MKRPTPRKAGRMAVAGGIAIGLLSGCVTLGSAQQPSLAPTDLAGTWVSADGSAISFTSGGTFTATKLNYGKYVIPGCGVLSGTGTWQLTGSGSNAGAGENNIVTLFFKKVTPPGSCLGFLELTSWDTSSTPGLCVQQDPDTPCNGYIFSKR